MRILGRTRRVVRKRAPCISPRRRRSIVRDRDEDATAVRHRESVVREEQVASEAQVADKADREGIKLVRMLISPPQPSYERRMSPGKEGNIEH